MSFPSVFSSFNRPTTSDKLNSPSHSALHNTVSSAVGQIEQLIGLSTSSAIGSLMYDIRSPNSGGGGHVQTANKGGTGQTSFAKGDVLVATSASVIAKLAVGTDGQTIVADSSVASGIKWGLPGTVPVTRVYSGAVAVWSKPSNLSYLVVQLQAPGGAGNTNNSNGAGGGGAGAFVQKTFAASALPAAASVLARAGGTGSILSYFGSVLQVLGGTTATAAAGGAAGSVLTAGDINYNGQAGTTGATTPGGASGGHSYLGSGGAAGSGDNGTTTAGDGQAGIFGGGGGGGSSASDGAPTGAGGAGGDGTVIVYEY